MNDCAFWSLKDTKLRQDDMAILLTRLLKKRQYKYISAGSNSYEFSKVNEDSDITYYEYLTMNMYTYNTSNLHISKTANGNTLKNSKIRQLY